MHTLSPLPRIGATLLLGFLISNLYLFGQDTAEPAITPLRGVVLNQRSEPLVGAGVLWKNHYLSAVSTDAKGHFMLERLTGRDTLTISYLGFAPLDIRIQPTDSFITIRMDDNEGYYISGAVVSHSVGAKTLDPVGARQITRFSEKEFTKAACCNLSESFENISAVDVTTTDAITGLRQIQMLGFSGVYIQTMVNNMPYATGLKSASGLTYIPGMFVKGMQLSKGVGSVTNGYDGMTGSLNIDLRKPYHRERLVLNGYFNPMNQRTEGNVLLTHQVHTNWATTGMFHYSGVYAQRDVNKDGFQDFPLQDNFQLSNEWMYMKGSWEGHIGIRHMDYSQELNTVLPAGLRPSWRSNSRDRRTEIHGMLGHIGSKEPPKSSGFRFSALQNDLQHQFGNRQYGADEKSLRASWVRQSIIGNTFHRITFGAQFQGHQTRETLQDQHHDFSVERKETVPGIFAELAETSIDHLVIVLGLRYDHHSYFGSIFTPRLHTKYALTEHTEWRLGAGRGRRTASPLSDFSGLLSANRQLFLPSTENGFYGLQQEVSWNTGTSISHCFKINHRPATLLVDYYYTFFDDQLQVDRDQNSGELHFYNIKALGLQSFSHSISAELDFSPIKRSEIRLAYRFIDSRSDFADQIRRFNPLISPHRAFANFAYETRNKWTFDATINWQSPKRLPQGEDLAGALSGPPTFSPSYTAVMAQVLKKIGTNWEWYAGGENLLDIRQQDLIRFPNNPEKPGFDPTLVWGPSLGAMFYIGFRYYVR
jgi:outer membrane receptor for ferrienterochelin and colicins